MHGAFILVQGAAGVIASSIDIDGEPMTDAIR